MSALRTPRNLAQATPMLARFAELEGAIAAIEGRRAADVAAISAEADKQLEPLVAERDAIRAKIAPWWLKAVAELTKGARKSMEIAGCLIGTRASRAALTMPADEAAAVKALEALRWAKGLLRVKVTVDRAAVAQALRGTHGAKLKALGFGFSAPTEQFFMERIDSDATIGRQ